MSRTDEGVIAKRGLAVVAVALALLTVVPMMSTLFVVSHNSVSSSGTTPGGGISIHIKNGETPYWMVNRSSGDRLFQE